jgi:hypothetical protein
MKALLNGATPTPVELTPHFELREIMAADIDQWWPKLRPEIEAIIQRSPEVCDFMPEEVYVFLKRRVAFLHVGFLDGEYAGFGILRKEVMPFSREPYLSSWVGAGLKGEAVDLYFAALDNIARACGAKKVQHMGRIGWMRRPPPGWRTVGVIQEKRLD